MEKIMLARKNIESALVKLHEAIHHCESFKKNTQISQLSFMTNQALHDSLRDSLIQRFEFSVDLFWKFLKKYLEEVVKTPPDINGPKPIIRAACKAKLFSEDEAELLLNMIESRNLTSHTYKEDLADRISSCIPDYYSVMSKVIRVL